MNYVSEVLLIDDQIDEAYPLMKQFINNGYNPLFVLPQDITDNMPFIPALVCCDINLLGPDPELNHKTINGILKKIFKEKIPYIFVAWTSHSEKLNELKEYLQNDSELIKPLEYISIDKNEFEQDNSILNIELQRIYDNNPDFTIFSMVKSLISKSKKDSINLLNKLYNIKDTEFRRLLLSIAQLNIGDTVLKNNVGIGLSAPIAYFLKDSVENNVYENSWENDFSKLFNNINPIPSKDLNVTLKASLNSYMHINRQANSDVIMPGDFIEIKIDKIRILLKNNKLKKGEVIEKLIKDGNYKNQCKIGLLEISADCDFSNNKTLGVCKFVFAYLIPAHQAKINNLPECFKRTHIQYNNQTYVLFVDARFLVSIHKTNLNSEKKLFNVRESLIKSFRQHIYSHNNRIGTISFP